MAKSLNEYMTTHFNTLLPTRKAVQRRVINEANRDINDSFGFVFDVAAPVKRQFPMSTPAEGACAIMSLPTFTHLCEWISRGSYSLLGRMDTALELPNIEETSVAKSNKKRLAVQELNRQARAPGLTVQRRHGRS